MIDSVNERIKFIRLLFGLKQREFCKFANLASSSLSRLESGGFNLSAVKIQSLSQKFAINPDFLLSGKGPIFSIQKKLILMKLLPSRFSNVNEYQEIMRVLIAKGSISEIARYYSDEDGPELFIFYSKKYSQYLAMLEELQYFKLIQKKLKFAVYSGSVSNKKFIEVQQLFKRFLLQFDNEKLNDFKKLCVKFVFDLESQFVELTQNFKAHLDLAKSIIPNSQPTDSYLSPQLSSFQKAKVFFIKFSSDLESYSEKEILTPPAIGKKIFELIQIAHKMDLSPEEFKAASELYELND